MGCRNNYYGPHPAGSLERALIGLAVATGISPSVWVSLGEESIGTALEILKEQGG